MHIGHGHLDELLLTLDSSREILKHLQLRLDFLNEKLDDSGTITKITSQEYYELNEFFLTRLFTIAHIDTITKIIFEKEEFFKREAQQFEIDVKEMNNNW